MVERVETPRHQLKTAGVLQDTLRLTHEGTFPEYGIKDLLGATIPNWAESRTPQRKGPA